MRLVPVSSYPAAAWITDEAFRTIEACTLAEFRRSGNEHGGLLWGRRCVNPENRALEPVIVFATEGVCNSTRTSCEILPQSWDAAKAELAAESLDLLENLGDWHSHPQMGAWLSSHRDVPSFWSHAGSIPDWMSMVVDPCRGEEGLWGRSGPQSLQKIELKRCSARAGERQLRAALVDDLRALEAERAQPEPLGEADPRANPAARGEPLPRPGGGVDRVARLGTSEPPGLRGLWRR